MSSLFQCTESFCMSEWEELQDFISAHAFEITSSVITQHFPVITFRLPSEKSAESEVIHIIVKSGVSHMSWRKAWPELWRSQHSYLPRSLQSALNRQARSSSETVQALQPQVSFGHIRGKQESCEKHFSHCKTELECEACNMETLWSGTNLFIKYLSVDYKWPFNMKHSHVLSLTATKSLSKSFMFFFHVWDCAFMHVSYLHHKCGCGISLDCKWGKQCFVEKIGPKE